MSVSSTGTEAELERLRARVAELERELLEVKAWANEVVAEAQRQTYWLERWHLDLNELMARRGAQRLRALARAVRAVIRAARRLRWRLSA